MGAGSALDPEISDWLAMSPAPDLDYRDVDAVRAMTARYMSEHSGPAPRWSRDDVVLSSSTVAGVDVLIWRPRDIDATHPLPVVLAFHGGAFIVGSPLGAERIASSLAGDHQVMTVSVGYRLAPEHPAPAALQDGVSVLRHLEALPGVDPQRIVVHGSSAGAAIAVGVAAQARDLAIPVALQSLSCPALDAMSASTRDASHSMHGLSPTLSRQSVIAMWDHYLARQSPAAPDLRYVIPSRIADLTGLPPAHLTIADLDVLRDEGLDYAGQLEAAGIEVDVDLVPGAVHGFDGLLPDSRIARASISRQVEAIAAALRA